MRQKMKMRFNYDFQRARKVRNKIQGALPKVVAAIIRSMWDATNHCSKRQKGNSTYVIS